MQVCGYAAHYAKASLTPYLFDRREPRDHDVAIDIEYSGICHSDIHQVNKWGGSTFPMVPGHEIAGIVSQVGTKVTRYKVGDRVAVGNFVDSCESAALAIKALSSIVWREQHGLIMQLKGMEKLKPQEVIQTRL